MNVCLNLAGSVGVNVAAVRRFIGYSGGPNSLIIDRVVPDTIDSPDAFLDLLGFDRAEWEKSRKDILMPWGAPWEGMLAKAIRKFGLGRGIRTFPVIGNLIYGQELGMEVGNSTLGYFPAEHPQIVTADDMVTEIVLDFSGISPEAEENASTIIGGSHRRVFRVCVDTFDPDAIKERLEELPLQDRQWRLQQSGVVLPWDNQAASAIMGAVTAMIKGRLVHTYALLDGYLIWYIWIMTIA
ncbi:MAG: hypothetical protein WCT32_00875 [Patescibacteria group bacterium]|jgi:hypothetical protein